MTTEHEQEEGLVKGAFNKASDTVGGMVGMAAASTTGGRSTGAFLTNAVAGNLYELQAANVALDRSRSEEVRSFARQMIDDHTTAAHQLRSALRMNEAKDLDPPSQALDDRRAGMVQHLTEASEDDFDGRYLDQQVMAHQETATLLKTYGEDGENPQLRSWATSSLPVVERHLEMARRIKGH